MPPGCTLVSNTVLPSVLLCLTLRLLTAVCLSVWQVLERVYDRLLPLVDGFNSLVQLHLLLLGTQALVHHPAAVVRITAHLHGQLANIRLKVRLHLQQDYHTAQGKTPLQLAKYGSR